jgi:hypothetical protein
MAGTKTAQENYFEVLQERFEKGTEAFFNAWKTGAKRPDRIGDVSYRTLKLVHAGAGAAARSLTHLEKTTQPPARTAVPAAHTPAGTHTGGRAHATPRHAAEKTGAGTS